MGDGPCKQRRERQILPAFRQWLMQKPQGGYQYRARVAVWQRWGMVLFGEFIPVVIQHQRQMDIGRLLITQLAV